ELDLALRGSGFAEAGWSRASAALRRPLALLAQVAVRAGDAPESFRLLQLATLSDMGEWEQRRKVAAAGADPDGRNRLETLRRTRESLMRADTALQEAVAAGDRSEARRHRQEMSVLREGLSEALNGFPDMARGGLTLRSLAEVRAALPPDQAVLMVVADPRPTAILVRSDRTVLRHTERLGAELQKAADGLRRAVLRGEASSLTDEAAALGWLFEAGDLDGVELLHVLGVDVYGRFPMHLLPDPSAPERWLGERVAINHLSGLDALFGEANAQTHSGRMPRLLALGDADFQGHSDVAPGMDEDADANAWNAALPASDPLAEALRRLPPLPGSRAEVEDITRTFGGEATLLLGPDATETAFRAARPEMADLIVLATHGLAAGQLPGLSEPALVFAQDDQADAGPAQDGLLTALEAADFVLSADLVILSACNTAAAEGGDPALSGLPRAFVSAGANSVMVSHWPVRDDAAAFLSTAVFTARQDGAQPAVALRDAMGALRASGLPDADDPSVWAPFVVVGG
ncbi:MAG: CHAT domain-containing protein, partial [Litorimonas sp.]